LRGPGAAEAYATDDLVVCLLTGVLTPAEQTLIRAGERNRVIETRGVQQAAVKEAYRQRMETVLARPVGRYMSAFEVDTGSIADCYLLGT
jgi:uncharacterized protein YbcI